MRRMRRSRKRRDVFCVYVYLSWFEIDILDIHFDVERRARPLGDRMNLDILYVDELYGPR
jgi:hypothetical protein